MQKNVLLKHKMIVQIFTGGYLEDKVEYQQIEKVLLPLLETGRIEKIIIGWSLQKEVYIQTLVLAKKYETECYLWLPVFSETGVLKPAQAVINRHGRSEKNYHLQEGENFEFYCPVNAGNLEQFITIYEENYKDLLFQGIFLDKIRYGSFSNGIESVCSCFCDTCREWYRKSRMNMEGLMSAISDMENGDKKYKETPFAIKSYGNAEYVFQDTVWEQFFRMKQKAVGAAVKSLANYFHGMGLKVGIDVFSPFLAYFVGQDIKELSEYVDFIKPMMYRITQAPAGLPFEAECMLKETVKGDIGRACDTLCRVLGCRDWKENGFDAEFVKKELECLCTYDVPVYCGIEVNQMDSVVMSTPEYIRENIETLGETDIAGFVLSWNLLSAPQRNIRAVFEKDFYL